MKTFYALAAIVVLGLFLSPFVLLPAEDAGVLKGKVVSYLTYPAKVRSLDPATCGDNISGVIQDNVYEGLYGYHYLKRPITLIPRLAEGMPQVSADGLTYTIKLKRGVKYHRNECFGRDGKGDPRTREVVAGDFVLAFKRVADYHVNTNLALAFIEDKIAGMKEYRDRTRAYAMGDFSRYDLPLKGVGALDDHTLRFHLTVPFPQLLYVLAIQSYAPIPREVIDYYLAQEPDLGGRRRTIPIRERYAEITDYRAVVGTGAYYLEKFADGADIILMRNPDFRDERYPSQGAPGDREAGLLRDAGKPLPLIDAYVLMYVAEENPDWQLFGKRLTDVSRVPRDMYTQVITPGKDLTDKWAEMGIRLVKYTDPTVYWLAFNMEDRVVGASKSLRQAMCLAFNVEDYIEVIFNGRGIRALTYVPNSFEAYNEAAPSPYARFDLKAAHEKLQQARRELEAVGAMKPGDDFPELTLDLSGTSEMDRRQGEFAQQQFKQIGLKVKVESNDWPTLQKKVEAKKCQIYTMGWGADYPDPENFLQLYYTPNIKRLTNNTNYSNPRFDELYKRAAVMQPGPRRLGLYVEALKILNEDCPVLLLTEPIYFILVQPWVENVKHPPFGYNSYKYRAIDLPVRRQYGGR